MSLVNSVWFKWLRLLHVYIFTELWMSSSMCVVLVCISCVGFRLYENTNSSLRLILSILGHFSQIRIIYCIMVSIVPIKCLIFHEINCHRSFTFFTGLYCHKDEEVLLLHLKLLYEVPEIIYGTDVKADFL